MSANMLDLSRAQMGGTEIPVMEGDLRRERRKRARTKVHWPVLLMRRDAPRAIETVTQNLSSTGFYCYTPESFTPGRLLFCKLKLPAYDPEGEGRALTLECTVLVMRAETKGDGQFGIAFRIEDYHLSE